LVVGGVLAAAAVVGAGAVVFASVPHSFTDGETLTAANLNGNFTAMDQRLTALEAALVPPGTIIAYGGPAAATADGGAPAAPAGWMLCDGSAVSRTTYSTLFAAIGINFGGGDGIATFNLPDLRGRFARGSNNGAGRDPDATGRVASNPGGNTGDKVGTLQGDQFKAHHHQLKELGTFNTGSPFDTVVTGNGGYAQDTGGVIDTGGNETRPVNVAVNYLIKL
jgi:microcystin-dependent protein